MQQITIGGRTSADTYRSTPKDDVLMAATIPAIVDPPEPAQIMRAMLTATCYTIRARQASRFDLRAIVQERAALVLFDLEVGAKTRGWEQLQMLTMHGATAAIPALICAVQKCLLTALEGHRLSLDGGSLLPAVYCRSAWAGSAAPPRGAHRHIRHTARLTRVPARCTVTSVSPHRIGAS